MKIERLTAKQYNQKYGGMMKEKKNKYGNKKTIIQNKKFDSHSEGELWWELEQQRKQGLIADIETQAKEELFAYGVHICNYYVDFKIIHNDGTHEFIEHKSQGTVTGEWRIKYKLLQAKYKDDKNIKISTNWYNKPRSINYKKLN